MSNFTHLDESIVTPKRARISKLFNGADSVYRATRVRVSSSPSVCRMKNKVFFLDSEHICTNAVVISMEPPRAPIPRRIERRFETLKLRNRDARVEIATHAPNRRANAAAAAIQRAWRKFRGKSLTRLATNFLSLGLSSPENCAAEYETYIKLLTHRETIAVCESLMARIESLTINAESNTRGNLSARTVLSSYMICHHHDVVLGVDDKDDYSSIQSMRELLLYSARKLTRTLDTMTQAALARSAGSLAPLIALFESRYSDFVRHLTLWKKVDAEMLEGHLIGIAMSLEASVLRLCGVAAVLDDAEMDCGDDTRNVIRDAGLKDRVMLRSKVFQVSGKEGVDRFDAALSDVHAYAVENLPKKSETPTVRDGKTTQKSFNQKSQATRDAIAKDKIVAESLHSSHQTDNHDEIPLERMMFEDRLLHELLVDEDCKLALHPSDQTEERALKDALTATMKKAFWDRTYESISNAEQFDTQLVMGHVSEFKDRVITEALQLELPTDTLEILELNLRDIDEERLSAVISKLHQCPFEVYEALQAVLGAAFRSLNCLALTRDIASNLHGAQRDLIQSLDAMSSEGGSLTSDDVCRAITNSLSALFETFETMHLRISLWLANASMEVLRADPQGPQYAFERFLSRHEISQDTLNDVNQLMLALPRTHAWIESIPADYLHSLDAEMSTLSISRHGEFNFNLRTGTSFTAKTEQTARGFLPPFKPVSVCSDDGVYRIAFVRLISSRKCLLQDFVPETFEFDEERLRLLQEMFQRVHLLAACAILAKQLGANSDEIEQLVQRIAALVQVETLDHELPTMRDIAMTMQSMQFTANSQDSTDTIVSTLMKLTADHDDNAMASSLIDSIKKAITIRLLCGFDDSRGVVSAQIKHALKSVAVVAQFIDAIVHESVHLLRVHQIARTPVIAAFTARLLAVDDEI
jgi:hypothetical protein